MTDNPTSGPGTATWSGPVVLIEDDESLARSLARILEQSGFQVTAVANAGDAAYAVEHLSPRLILLDLMLPDTDGLLLLPSLRSLTDAPIIVCSARLRQVDRVLGLKLGADDFVGKPFDLDELEARIQAVLRRASAADRRQSPGRTDIEVGDLLLSPTHGTASLAGARMHLTPTEYRLLSVLAERTGEVLSRETLAEELWGSGDIETGHVVDVHIGRLRQKLQPVTTAESTVRIETVRGRGFRLVLSALRDYVS